MIPTQFGIEVRMIAQAVVPADWDGVIRWAKDLGVSHFSFANRIVGGSLDEQIETCRQFVEADAPRMVTARRRPRSAQTGAVT